MLFLFRHFVELEEAQPLHGGETQMLTFDEIFSVFKVFLPLITTGALGGVVVSSAGLAPRIGPGRALWIGLRSRFAFKPVPESLRLTEMKLLRNKITAKSFGQGYLVVTGEKGVGKTCLIKTATSKIPGVITVKARPGDKGASIIMSALQELTRMHFDFIRPFHSAKRVVFWHRLFTLGRVPTVVITATERKVGEEYAGLADAARSLVDDYQLRVVIDGLPNSLDESVLRTTRERVIDIKPMSKEMIWQVDQLGDLFKYVKKAGLNDTIFAVLGGIPSRYEALWENARIDLQNGQDARQVIGAHLCAEISAAIKIVNDAENMDEIINLFDKDTSSIPSRLVRDKKLKRPTPDKVFREVKQDGVFVLIPASNAIGIALRHHLTKEPSLNELEDLINHTA